MSSNATSGARCFAPNAPEQGPPLFDNGHIVIQAHDIGWLLTAVFTVIAAVISGWLVNKHLMWYTNKHEQRYIVRILFMVPIYASISLASYLWWAHATPLLLLRDAYESTVLTAFFYLLLLYLSPDPEEQKLVFAEVGVSEAQEAQARRMGEKGRSWMWPLGWVRAKPSTGLYFLQMMKWGVLQYCVVRPVTTLIAVILNYIGLYCEDSWSPGWGHIWISAVVSISVTIAMWCLLQMYVPIASYLAPHKPLLKLIAIKAVVFLTFWQASFLSLLATFGIVKNTEYMTADDINTGWGAILETFEMVIFACLHLKAFTYAPYALPPARRTPRLRALAHALDPRETLRELAAGTLYLADRARARAPRADHRAARRAAHAHAFGRVRPRPGPPMGEGAGGGAGGGGDGEKGGVRARGEAGLDVDGRRRWPGAGGAYACGLSGREKSGALDVRIGRELARRGVVPSPARPSRGRWSTLDAKPPGGDGQVESVGEGEQEDGAWRSWDRHGRQRSWWSSVHQWLASTQPADDDLQNGDGDPGLAPLPRGAAPAQYRVSAERMPLYVQDGRAAPVHSPERPSSPPLLDSTARHEPNDRIRADRPATDTSPYDARLQDAPDRGDDDDFFARVLSTTPSGASASLPSHPSASASSHGRYARVLRVLPPQHAPLVAWAGGGAGAREREVAVEGGGGVEIEATGKRGQGRGADRNQAAVQTRDPPHDVVIPSREADSAAEGSSGGVLRASRSSRRRESARHRPPSALSQPQPHARRHPPTAAPYAPLPPSPGLPEPLADPADARRHSPSPTLASGSRASDSAAAGLGFGPPAFPRASAGKQRERRRHRRGSDARGSTSGIVDEAMRPTHTPRLSSCADTASVLPAGPQPSTAPMISSHRAHSTPADRPWRGLPPDDGVPRLSGRATKGESPSSPVDPAGPGRWPVDATPRSRGDHPSQAPSQDGGELFEGPRFSSHDPFS